MARYATLLVLELPLAAALRAEPELREHPVAIVEEGDERATILAGWMRGLTVSQARTVRPGLVVRSFSIEGMRSTRKALLDVARSVTPRIEEPSPGLVLLDLEGTEALFPSERGLHTALERRLADVGLGGTRVGMGPTRTVAHLAARHRGGGEIVPADAVREFLDPIPVDLLEPGEEATERLSRWGIRTLGELGQLPLEALGSRLGEEGVLLARRARGEDLRPFRPTPELLRFEEGTESEHPLANLEALAFLLRGVLDRLTRRLRLRGLAARELELEFTFESGNLFARPVRLAAPTLEVSTLLTLVRLNLEKDPPREPVERIRVIATPGSVESAQLDLFLPPLPAPAELAVTVARLETLCGTGRVGAPELENTHRPEAARTTSFSSERKSGRVIGELRSPARTARLRRASGSQLPREEIRDEEGARFHARRPRSAASPRDNAERPAAALALRALRPAVSVRVYGASGRPTHLEPLGSDRRLVRGRILHRAGPWRLFGEWWGESRFARDYFDVELSNGGVYRLYRNLANGSWFVDGIYD